MNVFHKEDFMNLRQLEYFKVLAETEHMTKTAKIMNTTQPNLSHAIKNLEEELGVELFRKQGRNIVLTKYGKMFYQTASNVIHDLEAGVENLINVTNPFHGRIDFGFTYTMALKVVPELISKFTHNNKYKNIRFQLNQGNSTQLIDRLLREEIDLAICSKISNDSRIHYQKFIEEQIILITPLDHPLAQYDEIDLQEIAPYPFIHFNESSGLRPSIDSLFVHSNIQPKTIFEVEEDHAMASFVQYGFGIALIPNIPTLDAYQIKKIKIKHPIFHRYLYIATLNESFHSEAVNNFINFINKEKESL